MVEESGSQKKQISANEMPPGTQDQLFPRFMNVPLELRWMIMKLDTLETPRILSLRKNPKNAHEFVGRIDKDKPFSARHYQVPAWLHVHSESREETMRSLEKVSFYRPNEQETYGIECSQLSSFMQSGVNTYNSASDGYQVAVSVYGGGSDDWYIVGGSC